MNKWVVSFGVVFTLIFSILGVQSHIEFNNFNPEEHIVHQNNGTNEFAFNSSYEVRNFGVYVKEDVECESMNGNEIEIGEPGWIFFTNRWQHDCSTYYDTDDYTYVGYLDLTNDEEDEYHFGSSNYDTILVVDISEIKNQPDFILLCYMLAIVGIIIVFCGWFYNGNNARWNITVWTFSNNSLSDESE